MDNARRVRRFISSLSNLKLRSKFLILVGTALAGLVTLTVLALLTLRSVAVNSELYKRIALANAIVADYVPPSQSMLEANGTFLLMLEDSGNAGTYIQRLAELRKEFEEGHAEYMRTMPAGPLKSAMSGEVYSSGEELWDISEREFTPLVKAGKLQEASQLRKTRMAPIYARHAAALDEIVKMANEQVTFQEKNASAIIRTRIGMMILFGCSLAAIMGVIGFLIGRGILTSVKRTVAVLEELARGELREQVEIGSADELGQMLATCQRTISAVTALAEDAKMLSEAGVEGRLSARADAGRHHGAYRKIIDGVNQTLDAVTGPLHIAAECVERISRGDVPPKITATYHGDFNLLKGNLNICIDAVNALVEDATMLAQAAKEGRLTARADASRHQGDFRTMIEGVNQTLDDVIGPLNVAARYVERIAKGDIPAKITETYHGDFNLLKDNLNTCISAMNALVDDANMLAEAAEQGKLATRAEAGRHQGAFRRMIEGVNQTLDDVTGPLNVAAKYVERIGQGDIPEKITDLYKGDFDRLIQSLNACIEGLGGLVEANAVLKRVAVNDCSRRVEGSYLGIFAEVAKATNDVQNQLSNTVAVFDALESGDFKAKLQELQRIGRRSEGDTLVPAAVRTMTSIEALVSDADKLAKAAETGRIGVRADAGKHRGDYRRIVEGMNQTLEAIVQPLKATAESATLLASSSGSLTAVSQLMASNAEETSVQASVVSAASEQVSQSVASVAAACEEMQASIREISKNANQSASVARNAVGVASTASQTVKTLGESSRVIGDVVKVITQIAEQTNLLALNATIEAARAGEAGKGFAVVANEVKELAKQTALATEDIGQKVEAIQSDSSGAVSAIEEISGIIDQINDLSNSIASAVEEQTVTTNEIGRSVSEAAQGVNDIAKNIIGVASTARNTTQGASDTKAASSGLSEMASRLQSAVAKFSF